jgi:hypothetical protein
MAGSPAAVDKFLRDVTKAVTEVEKRDLESAVAARRLRIVACRLHERAATDAAVALWLLHALAIHQRHRPDAAGHGRRRRRS